MHVGEATFTRRALVYERNGKVSRTRELLPLDAESPDVEVLSDPVAGLLRALCAGKMDHAVESRLAIPSPKSFRWAGLELDCDDASWVLDAGSLDLQLRRPKFGRDAQLNRMFNVLNQSAEFDLEDGSTLSARLAHLVSRNDNLDLVKRVATTTYRFTLDSWTWWPAGKHLWVGRLDGPRVDDGNLVVCGDHGSTARNLRLTGEYCLYLVEDRKAGRTTLLVDTGEGRLEQDVLGTDFTAMEFVLGRPLGLGHLLAVDDRYKIVGASGLSFGGWTTQNRNGRCPVATPLDLYANCPNTDVHHLWVPLLFSQVATTLHAEGPDSPLLIAVAAYIDSIAAGNVHVSYLLVQIALEALSAAIVPSASGVLVTDPKRWLRFVDEHENEIRSFATDDEAAGKLVNKVKSAQQAPSTGRVAAALQHFGLYVSSEELAEIGRRNSSAHRYVMAAESKADVQDLADRLAMVQTLLVAIIAKYVGHKGPIVGSEWIRGRHKIPDWWAWEWSSDASKRYLVTPSSEGPGVLGRRELIERAAYFRWINRGCDHGNDVEDWLAAEREQLAECATSESRPSASAEV